MSGVVECDCWNGHWVRTAWGVVRLCAACCRADCGRSVAGWGCGCPSCAADCRRIVGMCGFATAEGPPSFWDRLAQAIVNGMAARQRGQVYP